MILNIYYNDFQHMGMSKMSTGAGKYFWPSKPHSGTLCDTPQITNREKTGDPVQTIYSPFDNI